MPSQTNERALEVCIETALAGISREQLQTAGTGETEIKLQATEYRTTVGHGYQLGWSADFDKELAVDTEKFWNFLYKTQPDELAKLKQQPQWEALVLQRLTRKIKKDGILKTLKTGLDIHDAHLCLFYSPPYNDLNPDIIRQFRLNTFSVTRQLYYSPSNPRLSMDMVLFINGLPLATLEMKKSAQMGGAGQTVQHAIRQYQQDRDPRDPLLEFGRCLVHFAADENDVFMTTELQKEKTFFLPFNQGSENHGKGNPHNPNGYRSAYLWEEILTRESLAHIIQHFATLIERKDPKTGKLRRALYFPRYHQWDVVRKLLEDVRTKGVGQTYLIQHSAGSGKTNSITWLAYQLIEVYPTGAQRALFDSVIVVTDRKVLDRQLRDNIKQFSEQKNIIAPAFNAQELKAHLENHKKIIITTIQKFRFIVEAIEDQSDKRFAVIIDEAHSSQSGESADMLNRSLGELDDEDEVQDAILEAMKRRKLRHTASYFAFTATPKGSTLEKFGIQQPDGKFKPFHLYSMKQAIEEGFILDVLANYTTYQSYYELKKSVEDNPLFAKQKAQKKLRAYVEGAKETIAVKADVIVSHFIEHLLLPKKLNGNAKGMVVTRNIDTAIDYFLAIRDALQKARAPFKAMIAFSPRKGLEHTEESLNAFPEAKSKDDPRTLEEFFDTDDYRLLIVANKFLTGFDQPKLAVMYVDKKLQSVLAVQALSRLNRSAPALGKRTEDVFVLDFFNTTADIKDAFDPFYTSTSLSKATDVNVLHDLREALGEVGVYEWQEVAVFSAAYWNGVEGDKLDALIGEAANRFNHELELDDDQKADFKIKAKQFVKVYAQVACILRYERLEWEQLYWFLKYLIPKLVVKRRKEQDQRDALLESVDLSTYALSRTQLKAQIELDEAEGLLEPQNPQPRGVHPPDPEEDSLDAIIHEFNQRWFQGWGATPEEQRIKWINIARHIQAHPDFQSHFVDNTDEQNRQLAVEKIFKEAVNKSRRDDLELYRRYATDTEFQRMFNFGMLRFIEQQMKAGVQLSL